MFCLELALAISLISLGSSQTLFLPHFITLAAKRFWSLSELILRPRGGSQRRQKLGTKNEPVHIKTLPTQMVSIRYIRTYFYVTDSIPTLSAFLPWAPLKNLLKDAKVNLSGR